MAAAGRVLLYILFAFIYFPFLFNHYYSGKNKRNIPLLFKPLVTILNL